MAGAAPVDKFWARRALQHPHVDVTILTYSLNNCQVKKHKKRKFFAKKGTFLRFFSKKRHFLEVRGVELGAEQDKNGRKRAFGTRQREANAAILLDD